MLSCLSCSYMEIFLFSDCRLVWMVSCGLWVLKNIQLHFKLRKYVNTVSIAYMLEILFCYLLLILNLAFCYMRVLSASSGGYDGSFTYE